MRVIKFACPHCDQHLEATDDMSADTIECPKCKAILELPEFAEPGEKRAKIATIKAPPKKVVKTQHQSKHGAGQEPGDEWRRAFAHLLHDWQQVTRPRFFVFYAIVWGYAAVDLARPDSAASVVLLGITLVLATPPLVWSFLRLLWHTPIVIYRTLRDRIKKQEQALTEGRFTTFFRMTMPARTDPLSILLYGIMDVVMFPFPYFFYQHRIPNVLADRWRRWPFLQSIAVAWLVWVYLMCVVGFYAVPILVGTEYADWSESVLQGIGWVALAILVAGMVVSFTVLLAKGVVELVSVFLKIEENTRSEKSGSRTRLRQGYGAAGQEDTKDTEEEKEKTTDHTD